jgi:hypothetical protein
MWVVATIGSAAIIGVAVAAWLLRPRRAARFPGLAQRTRAGDRCLKCRTGTVRRTTGRYGDFLGCSMYTVTGCSAAWTLRGVRIRGRNYGKVG